jgi:hypothetical protein
MHVYYAQKKGRDFSGLEFVHNSYFCTNTAAASGEGWAVCAAK